MYGRLYHRKMEALERRRTWLDARIANYQGRNDSHDRAERAALDLALGVLRENEDIALEWLQRQKEGTP